MTGEPENRSPTLVRFLPSIFLVKLADTLRECAELERRIAGFYDQFAALWPDSEVGAFWRTMADEERVHGSALDDLAATIGASSPRQRFDRSALAQLRGYVVGTGRLLGEISLDDAFRATLDLEQMELHRVYYRLSEMLRAHPKVPADAVRRCFERLGPHSISLPEMVERFARAADLLERAATMRLKEAH